MARLNGLLAALFDFSFTELVTTRLARVVYGVVIGVAGLLGVVVTFLGFGQSPLLGLVGLLIGCAVCVVSVVTTRLWLEAAVVFLRVAEHIAEMVEHEAEIAMNTAGPRDPAERATSIGSP